MTDAFENLKNYKHYLTHNNPDLIIAKYISDKMYRF